MWSRRGLKWSNCGLCRPLAAVLVFNSQRRAELMSSMGLNRNEMSWDEPRRQGCSDLLILRR